MGKLKIHLFLGFCLGIIILLSTVTTNSPNERIKHEINIILNKEGLVNNSYKSFLIPIISNIIKADASRLKFKSINYNKEYDSDGLCIYVIDTSHPNFRNLSNLKTFSDLRLKLPKNMIAYGPNIIIIDSKLLDFLFADVSTSIFFYTRMLEDNKKNLAFANNDDAIRMIALKHGAISTWHKLNLISIYRDGDPDKYIKSLCSDASLFNARQKGEHNIHSDKIINVYSFYLIPYLGHELGHLVNNKRVQRRNIIEMVLNIKKLFERFDIDNESSADAYSLFLTEALIERSLDPNKRLPMFEQQMLFEAIKLNKYEALFDVFDGLENKPAAEYFVYVKPKSKLYGADPFDINSFEEVKWNDINNLPSNVINKILTDFMNDKKYINNHLRFIRALFLGSALNKQSKEVGLNEQIANTLCGDIIDYQITMLLYPKFLEELKFSQTKNN